MHGLRRYFLPICDADVCKHLTSGRGHAVLCHPIAKAPRICAFFTDLKRPVAIAQPGRDLRYLLGDDQRIFASWRWRPLALAGGWGFRYLCCHRQLST